MGTPYERGIREQIEIAGRLSAGRDVFVRPKLKELIELLWPGEKPAALLAAIGKRDERTAKRWLAGEFEVPLSVARAISDKVYQALILKPPKSGG